MNTSKWRRKLFATTTVVISILILAALVTSAHAGTSDKVSISVPVSDIGKAKIQQVSGNQSLINIGSFPQGGNPGDPMLPYKSITLLVPPDADLAKVTAGLVSESWEELPGEYDIAAVKPAAASVTVSWGGKDPSRIVNGQDIDIYGSDAFFPSKTVEVTSVGKFRQWKLVELRVWLAAYNPVQKKVRVLKDTQAVLNVEKLAADKAVGLDAATLPSLPNTEKFLPALKSKIANPQDIDKFYVQQSGAQAGDPAPSAPGTVPADYVIITTNQIVTNSTKLANFITAKTTAGFTVKTVTEGAAIGDFTYVTGATNDARANNIRNWLVNYWAGDGIQYVLLIGNPNPTGAPGVISLPMKRVWPRGTVGADTNCPTDMYYAELSGNWDLDGDGSYGEFSGDYGFGGADKNCELKVGRIPVYDANCAVLDTILQKCIDYDTATGNKAWRSKVLVPAAISNFGPQDNNGDGDASDPDDYQFASDQTFGDDWGEAIKSLATSNMVTPYTLYEQSGVYNNGTAYPLTACNAALNNANFINEWKNQYGFVTWWAHGNATSASRFTWNSDATFVNVTGNWAPHLETSFTTLVSNADCASLDDNKPSFVVQVSCENAWPENSNNLGFRLLRQGAIGTISGTRVTWYSIGSWNTWIGGNTGDNASYGYYGFDRMAVNNEDIGTALVWCRSNFGTNWADGASWMNMVEFTIYGDPALKLGLTSSAKWIQPPDTSENGIDIRCDTTDQIPRLLADDFLCTQTGPITKVTIWGSWFHDWYGLKGVIKNIHLSIHSDKPDPDGNEGPLFSEPNELLWERTFTSAEISESLFKDEFYEFWWDPYTMPIAIWPGDTQIWQYDINIPSGGFVQQGDPCNPIIYWLDVNVEQDMAMSPPGAMFGWKTAKNHWNDDAVRWEPGIPGWVELRYPPEHPYCPNSIDLSFMIYTGPQVVPKEPVKHLKWSQPPIETDSSATNITFCGWDEKSFAPNAYNPQAPFKMVADDFRCLGSMPITSIHWWGSYFDWEQGAGLPPVVPTQYWIGFWSNQPVGPFPYSYPNILLHSFLVDAGRVEIEKVGTDQYYGEYPNDICFQYTLNLNPEEVFWQNDFNEQTQDNVFWLSIVAVYPDSPEPIYNPWGWKTRPWHWMDDAITVNLPLMPAQGYMIDPTIDIVTPLVDPVWQDSMDVSFELDTDPNYIKWEQDFNGIRTWPHYEDVNSTMNMMAPETERLVADDWRCLRRTPVTAIVWWGSYIGYQYEACGTTLWPLPVPPDRFRLSIWTDVPAPQGELTIAAGSTDNSVYVYDKAGNLLWSYDTGYDVLSVAVSDDGAYVAAGATSKLYLFARDGTMLWEKDVAVQDSGGGWMGTESKSVAISADGEYVAAGCSDGLYVYKKDGSLHWSHAGRETCVAISGNYIAACEQYGEVHLFSMSSSTPLWTDSFISAFWLATSDSGYVIASDSSSTIYLYDSAGTQIWSYSDAKWAGDYIRVDMSQDGLSLAAINDDPQDWQGCNICYLNHLKDGTTGWSATDGTPVWSYDPGGGGSDFYSVTVSENGEYIATGPTGGSYVFSKGSNVPVQTINMQTANSYDLTNNGQYGVCGNRQGELYLFSKDSSTPIWMKTAGEKIHTVAIARGYSHPGNAIWQYETEAYDEVLVGYDKHPELQPPLRTEPVFRYSVPLPEPNWFRQPDYNEVFWLSVQAVYDVNLPNYIWGWTNHQHVFNDDAVQGYIDETSGLWVWNELSDQTGASEDMSFVLFTDPNECSTCANYNCDALVNFVDYSYFADNWLAIVPPGGYDNSDLDCDGTIGLLDLAIFTQQWLIACP